MLCLADHGSETLAEVNMSGLWSVKAGKSLLQGSNRSVTGLGKGPGVCGQMYFFFDGQSDLLNKANGFYVSLTSYSRTVPIPLLLKHRQ